MSIAGRDSESRQRCDCCWYGGQWLDFLLWAGYNKYRIIRDRKRVQTWRCPTKCDSFRHERFTYWQVSVVFFPKQDCQNLDFHFHFAKVNSVLQNQIDSRVRRKRKSAIKCDTSAYFSLACKVRLQRCFQAAPLQTKQPCRVHIALWSWSPPVPQAPKRAYMTLHMNKWQADLSCD